MTNQENHTSQPLNSNYAHKMLTFKKIKPNMHFVTMVCMVNMNGDCGSWGQQRTGGLFHNLTSHRCPESAPPLPVCELSGLVVHRNQSLEEKCARRGETEAGIKEGRGRTWKHL